MKPAEFKVGDRVATKASVRNRILRLRFDEQSVIVTNMEWADDGKGWGYVVRFDDGNEDYWLENDIALVIEEKR